MMLVKVRAVLGEKLTQNSSVEKQNISASTASEPRILTPGYQSIISSSKDKQQQTLKALQELNISAAAAKSTRKNKKRLGNS